MTVKELEAQVAALKEDLGTAQGQVKALQQKLETAEEAVAGANRIIAQLRSKDSVVGQ